MALKVFHAELLVYGSALACLLLSAAVIAICTVAMQWGPSASLAFFGAAPFVILSIMTYLLFRQVSDEEQPASQTVRSPEENGRIPIKIRLHLINILEAISIISVTLGLLFSSVQSYAVAVAPWVGIGLNVLTVLLQIKIAKPHWISLFIRLLTATVALTFMWVLSKYLANKNRNGDDGTEIKFILTIYLSALVPVSCLCLSPIWSIIPAFLQACLAPIIFCKFNNSHKVVEPLLTSIAILSAASIFLSSSLSLFRAIKVRSNPALIPLAPYHDSNQDPANTPPQF